MTTLNAQISELNTIKNENNDLKKKITTLNDQVSELNTIKNENKDLKNKMTTLNAQVSELNTIKNENNNLNNQITTLNAQVLELNKIKNENNNLKNKITTLNDQVSELNTIKNENKDLKNKITALNNQKLKLEKYQNENAELKNKIEKLEKNFKNLTEPNPKGLDNIGATCYMNATLQSLYNTSNLSEYFLEKYKEDKNKIMAHEYYTVVKNLSEKNDAKSYAPHSFKNVLSRESPLFEGVNANDSKDLINFLIERFHQELNEIKTNKLDNNQLITQQDQLNEKKMLDLFLIDFKAKFNSVISNLFYGVMETKSKCQGCNSIKYNFQVFSFLEFPLEQVNKYCYTYHLRDNYTSNNNSNPDVDLYECFNYYGHLDLMNGENQMYCNICKRNCDAFYQTNLYSLPNYLIINLNRGKGAVYQCKVNFPEKLNLLNFVTYQDGNTYFELYAVICHHGPSSMSGHFIAYCKNKIDKKWYIYNDSIVLPCQKKEEYRNGMPYILFYQAL